MPESKFQTIVDIPEFHWKTGYGKKNLFMGSCFTENVGNSMEALKYDVDINPFGILYNPVSVANGLRILLENKKFQQEDLVEHDGLWHSFYHHGRFSGTDIDETLSKINDRINQSAEFLRNTDFLFLTFGTSWIYEYKKTGKTVSNCHKIPTKEFKRFRLTPGEIIEEYRELLPKIWKINPDLKVIFTVSPIRHWKDGAIENQLSKATLLLAIERIIQGFGKKKCAYFPAYEIVMDELRDYRFYTEDMIHISEVAINHIWSVFEQNLVDENSQEAAKQVQKINKALNHKPFNPLSQEYIEFLKRTLKQTEEIGLKFPNLNFELEKKHFNIKIDEIRNQIEHF
jgi:hypothetical protein